MARPVIPLDEVLTSISSTVEQDGLGSPVVDVLARYAIHRLASDARRKPLFDVPLVSDESLTAFCAALIQPTPDAALRFIEDLREQGMTRSGICLVYICDAARRLGDGWDQDRFSLLDVLIGIGHIYTLMRVLRVDPQPFDPRRCALFATVPGEEHSLGVTVAANLFRDAGWHVDLHICSNHETLIAHAKRTQPPVVGLSLSSTQRLEALARLIEEMRIVAPRAIIGVAPGRCLDKIGLSKRVHVDLVFDDARAACLELERLIRLRGSIDGAIPTREDDLRNSLGELRAPDPGRPSDE